MTDQEPTKSKPTGNRPTSKELKVLLIIFVVIELFTAGFCFENVESFGGQTNIEFVAGLKSDVWLQPTNRGEFGIPLVIWGAWIRSPYSVRIQIWDKSEQFSEIEVAMVFLKYSDGTTVVTEVAWTRRLRPYVQRNSSTQGIIETPMMKLSDIIPNVLDRHEDVEMTLEGEMIRKDGSRVPFKSTEIFEATTDFRIFTGWQWASRI